MNIEFIDKTFKEYVNTFNMEDENIYLKYEHTFEVVKFSESIARKLNLSEEDIKIIEALKLGARRFITKPFEKNEVISCVESIVRSKFRK